MPWTNWITNNPNGSEQNPIQTEDNARVTRIEVREQGGYGIINARLRFGDTWTNWACINSEGVIKGSDVPAGHIASGVTIKEQAGYGVVDLRLNLTLDNGTPSSTSLTPWVCNNPNGLEKKLDLGAGQMLTGLAAREQSGHGIVDLRMYYAPITRSTSDD